MLYEVITPAVPRWARYFFMGALFTGIIWGVFAGYIVQLPDLLRIGAILFLNGVVALISVMTCAGSFSATVAFSSCALIPPAALLV